MNITYQEAKRRARKDRDIWVRKLICDPITTPLAYLLARYTNVQPLGVTLVTWLLGLQAALQIGLNNLDWAASFYFLSFLSDSVDGKLNRVLGRDDTFRGIIDFISDGIICFLLVVAMGLIGDMALRWLLLVWMSTHYLDMRFTSATYRLKVQFRDSNIWLINNTTEMTGNWLIRIYSQFVRRTHTYPHPTVGEAIILMFVVGPLLWHFTGNIAWEHLAVVLGTLFTIPETVGAAIIAFQLARRGGR